MAITILTPASALAAPGDISTVAGTGTAGYTGDGGPATAAQLNSPAGIAATPDGGFLVADAYNNVIRKVSAAGTISTVAGDGVSGDTGDGGLATAARLNGPYGVAVTPDGGFLIADTYNMKIRKVSTAGVISTVAGTGISGYTGEGLPATSAKLANPEAVAPTPDGGFLIADFLNSAIRWVSPAGLIFTRAGDGTPGFAGDGGAASASRLDHPEGVYSTSDGGYLIADTGNHRIRKVSPAGVISTIAGNGGFGFMGDGGVATAAQLYYPTSAATTPDGGLLIADNYNYRARRVNATGEISTAAGDGSFGYIGDAVPATTTSLSRPWEVIPTADGGFLIADRDNNRVRKVAGPDSPLGPIAPPPPVAAAATGQRAAALKNCKKKSKKKRKKCRKRAKRLPA